MKADLNGDPNVLKECTAILPTLPILGAPSTVLMSEHNLTVKVRVHFVMLPLIHSSSEVAVTGYWNGKVSAASRHFL